MKEYMLELYENYMLNHCTCDRSDAECMCLSYEDFCNSHYEKMQEEWAQLLALEPVDNYA